LRVLRVARFLARFGAQGFRVADDTRTLMTTICQQGEVDHLTPERVWQETERALLETSPDLYFSCLRECGALRVLMREVDALFGVPQTATHHPEIDTGIHTLMALQQGLNLCRQRGLDKADSVAVMWSVLTHDLGKALTPAETLPSHPGHEPISAHLADNLSQRLRAPTHARQLAVRVAELHTHCHRAFELRPATLMRTLESLDFLRRPQLLSLFLLACEADSRGRTGFEKREYPQADYMEAAAEAARRVTANSLIETRQLSGKALGDELRKKRIDAIAHVKRDFVGHTAP
jgi:tRNA nucleotidyltransferase (CCA-adding enzyme)